MEYDSTISNNNNDNTDISWGDNERIDTTEGRYNHEEGHCPDDVDETNSGSEFYLKPGKISQF